MNDPLVSVVIPTYNCGECVEEAIDSVLSQTYRNQEIIVVNDGSTDDTASKLEKYKDRIRLVTQANRGLSGARNTGLELSTGEYVAFLDADDRWLSGKLEQQIACFRELDEIEMVFSNFSAIDPDGNTVAEDYLEGACGVLRKDYGLSLSDIFPRSRILAEPPVAGLRVYPGSVFTALCKGNFILPSTTIYRRKSLENIGLLYNESYRCAEEQDFHLRFAIHYSVAYLDVVTTEYRIGRKGKLTSNANTPQLILNTIETAHDVFRRNENLMSGHKNLYRTVVGKHHARLAYYYLSVLDRKNARKHAVESLKYAPFMPKPIAISLLSFLPVFVLNLMGRLKSRRIFSRVDS
jgi:glycosyltransferase involved in cell wall biosynthesis